VNVYDVCHTAVEAAHHQHQYYVDDVRLHPNYHQTSLPPAADIIHFTSPVAAASSSEPLFSVPITAHRLPSSHGVSTGLPPQMPCVNAPITAQQFAYPQLYASPPTVPINTLLPGQATSAPPAHVFVAPRMLL